MAIRHWEPGEAGRADWERKKRGGRAATEVWRGGRFLCSFIPSYSCTYHSLPECEPTGTDEWVPLAERAGGVGRQGNNFGVDKMHTLNSLSVQFSHSVVSNSFQLHGLQHTRLPFHHQLPELAQTHPLSRWRHPTISSSVIPFSSCLQSFAASGSFPMSHQMAKVLEL